MTERRTLIATISIWIYAGRDDDLFYPKYEGVSLPKEMVKALRLAAEGQWDNRTLAYPEPDPNRPENKKWQLHLQFFEGDEEAVRLVNSVNDYRKSAFIKNIYRYFRERPPIIGFSSADGIGRKRSRAEGLLSASIQASSPVSSPAEASVSTPPVDKFDGYEY